MASTSTEHFCKLLRTMKADEHKAPKDYMALQRAGQPFLTKQEMSQIRMIAGEERKHYRIVGDIEKKVC